MSKDPGKKSFLDYFKVKESDDDYDDDDFFDDDDDYDDDDSYSSRRPTKKNDPVKSKNSYGASKQTAKTTYTPAGQSSYQPTPNTSYSSQSYKKPQKPVPQQENKLVSIDANQRRQNYRPSSEVYVIRPVEFDDAQTVSDFLRAGKTIVINMEGVQIDPAQRIIDFIGGACYGLGGDLKAISANIFIAAPNNIEVSGDLRDEILNESTLSPQLGKY